MKEFIQKGLFGADNLIVAKSKREIDAEKIQAKERKDAHSNMVNRLNTEFADDFSKKLVSKIGTLKATAVYKPHTTLMMDKFEGTGAKHVVNEKNMDNLNSQNGNDNHYNGYLSPATIRVIKNRLDVWLTSIDCTLDLANLDKNVNRSIIYPTFVTLTLPSKQMHDDRDLKKYVLDPFLSWLKIDASETFEKGELKGKLKGFGVDAYFWRAETQENGNLHFHIICDRYIPWDRIRQKWNKLCENLGYISRHKKSQEFFYRDGFRIKKQILKKQLESLRKLTDYAVSKGEIPKNVSELHRQYLTVAINDKIAIPDSALNHIASDMQKRSYEAEMAKPEDKRWRNPNSTDIHAIDNLSSISAYVSKYISKKPIEKPIKATETIETRSDGKWIFEKRYISNDEYFLENERKYRPTFTTRLVRGNLWGCTQNLKPKFEKNENDEIVNTNELKYFSKVISETEMFSIYDFKTQDSTIKLSQAVTVDASSGIYCSKLIEKIGDQEIDRITEKVGPSFAQMNGKVIPIMSEKFGYKKVGKKYPPIKQQVIMAKLSPKLADEYVDYYKNMFRQIYSIAS